jgi:hypothetical protein
MLRDLFGILNLKTKKLSNVYLTALCIFVGKFDLCLKVLPSFKNNQVNLENGRDCLLPECLQPISRLSLAGILHASDQASHGGN